jgi:hypothetical protein
MSRTLDRIAHDESGVVLVFALMMLIVLTTLIVLGVDYGTQSSRHASRSNAGDQAYGLAQAGLNDAVAQLSPHYVSNTTTAGDDTWVGGTQSTSLGTVSWTGSFDAGTNHWSLTGTGTVDNPAAPGSSLVRTAKATVDVGNATALPFAFGFQYFMYDPTACAPAAQNSVTNSGAANLSVYVAGCLSITGASRIVEPSAPGGTLDVYVGGLLSIANSSSSIGGTAGNPSTNPWPIHSVDTPGGCKFATGPVTACGPTDYVWANAYSTAVVPPGPAWHASAATIYSKASCWATSGCAHPVTCSTGTDPFDTNTTMDGSVGAGSPKIWRPFSGSSFNCTAYTPTGAVLGSLSWNSATGAVAISGTVFIDTPELTIQNNDKALYGGNGTLYVEGWVNMANTGSLCGPGTGAAAAADCPGEHWNPSTGEMLIWALNNAGHDPSIYMTGSSFFEGGVVADSQTTTKAHFSADHAGTVRGPVIGAVGDIVGDGKAKAFAFVPSGSAIGGTTTYTLGTPYNFG